MSDVHWTTSKYYNYVASPNFWVVSFWPWVSLRNEGKIISRWQVAEWVVDAFSFSCTRSFTRFFFPFHTSIIWISINILWKGRVSKSFIFMILQITFSLSQWNFARIWFGIFKEQSDLTHFWPRSTLNMLVIFYWNFL